MSFAFLGCNPQQVDDTAKQVLGTEALAGDSTYVYIRAKGAVSKGAACIITDEFDADEVTTALADDSYPMCIPQTAIADDKFGWGLIIGKGELEVGNACAANTSLSTTTTAGRLDDADSAGRVSGLMTTVAATSAGELVGCNAYRPRLDILA